MNLDNIFQNLEIENNSSVVYFHIYSDILKPVTNIKCLFDFIDYYFDKKSTICMPSFPFVGSNYFDYLKKKPVFDVRKTPCRTNLASEIFRRKAFERFRFGRLRISDFPEAISKTDL